MKLSDFIAQFLYEQGIKDVFVVSGGAIIHSIDSVARHPKMSYVCVQHEQAAGAAADAYWRTCGKVGTVMVTSGPGATNLTTSICNAYFDSIPILCICGQVTTPRLRPHDKLRQKGFQETDIIALFSSITKYVVRVMDPLEIKYQLQKALYIAQDGRPGPVALDIPDDLQRMDIDVSKLKEFIPPRKDKFKDNTKDIQTLLSWIEGAKRPLVIYGAGIRIAGVIDPALEFIRQWGLPAVLTWGGKDMMSYDDPLNMGGIGVVGPRSGNFAAQNADLIIAVGTRLSQMITGGKTILFAPHAKKVLVDIDPFELSKFTPNDFHLDLGIESDFPSFFQSLSLFHPGVEGLERFASWRAQIKNWEKKYPVCPLPKYHRHDYVDGHVFVKTISNLSRPGDIFIADTGANISWTLQAIEMKIDQRIFSAWNHTPMGYALSAAVGAAKAANHRILCLTGDGGLMMNIEELATIRRYNLNVKLFIFNNGGHSIQKQTIDTWLNSNYAGVDERTGLSFPDFVKTAQAFHLPAFCASNHDELESVINKVLTTSGPVVCDIIIDPNQKIEPMLRFGSGLEDLNPKLPPLEIARIMSVSETGSFTRPGVLIKYE
jgi:acetolactate synthase I/II/III large subunit